MAGHVVGRQDGRDNVDDLAAEGCTVNAEVQELRDGLSRFLAQVRDGRTVTVTDHGWPIARIVPVDRTGRLEQVVSQGRVRGARTRKVPAPRPVVGTGTVSDLVAEQRR
ncbi:type II toxin-antitoxin system prevent-host-death family antitoxin [Georgenia sp. TF02-10]|uniref:type II toxin-antitoxin system Phd/YefM family antitoxin n=1 Tax=Georgenia sp. TF02-10 TaxID=2917725 RepID=UPI001FA7DFDC|nr:type II toxin-antitoxin system prevent-host-death family antitoxin [Georgenia sp. TF02-10]UNX55564.1 type II toxin-antitoxin system prevent-host-death family antitoxin [Georgenia sp. TF02-10]